MENYLLALFIPGRRDLGAIRTAFEKFDVQYVDGCAEPGVAERYADQRGVLLTLAGWTPALVTESKTGAPRVTLPESIRAVLANAHGNARDGIEVAVLTPARGMRYHAQIKLERLDDPVAVGCRYEVLP